MTLNRIPTYLALTKTKQQFRRQDLRYRQLTQQLTTNLKVQEIIEHKTNLHYVQDTRNRVNYRERLMKGIERVQPVVETYSISFEALIESANDLFGYSSIQSADYDSWVSQVRPGVESFLKSFTGILNTRVLGRYIFSGTRFEEPPVKLKDASGANIELQDLPNFQIPHVLGQNDLHFDSTNASGARLFGATNPTLPIYDIRYDIASPGKADVDSYRSLTQFVEYGNPLPYSISSNHEAIQKIFHAAQLLYSATTQTTGPNALVLRTEIIAEAQTATIEAIEDLKNLRNQNDLNKYILNEAHIKQRISFETASKYYAKATTIENPSHVAVELNSLSTIIQASYQLLERRNQLSLVNFL